MKTNFLGMVLGVVLIGNVLAGCGSQQDETVEVTKVEKVDGLEKEKAMLEEILQDMKDEAQADREEFAAQLEEITRQLEELKALKDDEPFLPCGTEDPELVPTSYPLPAPAPPVVEKGTPAGEPLAVKEVTPSQGAAEVSKTPTIQVVFSKPVDESTMTSSSFYLFRKGVTTDKILGKVQKVSDTTYTLSSIALESWTEYVGVITKEVKTASGETLWTAYSWSFTTEMPLIGLPPVTSPF